ncbi:hypothetical protein N7489_009231 [Penicillium chrysogenum]|uniref:Uncharacterized protein n=1 Tax=Penicillium chrysogenum TaxID=5076 RepID=A0ABQ8X0F8_PENCH|nr:uncharacterized protein N7489_009231 [Penicillium chrysogenum]XP_061069727.1 uncharacterized protein N7525_003433 [Penicillium rubens]KAJ5228523.1 hypothetical protein N7489_009231 [Penicillium chrysogenum]KAJ5257921.1 hypothetical protein N7524_009477 [Penicillium chrysogenum]KAJ5283846.1 hypothetical protein N7505_001826 [Penicillium chrysogenum]KAJ5838245.1 hypothetical protein N7525_003433 [Penicillium rubens]KAJ5866293.1 hypothetical protein N7534_000846 [Penicillium rubens]
MTAMAQASDPSQVIGPLSLFELGAVNSRPCEKMCKLLGRAVNDPYHEFIPAMLERYNIDADWLQNTLSVVCGDEAGTREDADPHASLIAKGADCMIAAFVSVFLHLAKCPTAMSQLKHEVDIAFRKEALPDILQKETELHTLPFLDAVMKESMRLAMRFDYRRDVPAGGIAVLGHYLPEGTVVQFHSEPLRNNYAIFGEDVSSFRLQRWLQADLDRQQLRQMEEALLRAAALIIRKFDLHPLNYEEAFIRDAVSPEQEYDILVNFTPRMH